MHELTSTSANGDEGSSGASPMAPIKGIAGGRPVAVGEKLTPIGEQQAEEVQPILAEPAKEASAGKSPTREQPAVKSNKEPSATGQSVGEPISWEKSAGMPTLVQ
ncbi:unnamed protein product [Closterium sp. NIES-54]